MMLVMTQMSDGSRRKRGKMEAEGEAESDFTLKPRNHIE
jgi:hypothetical protein